MLVNKVAKLVYLCFLIHSGIIANIDIGISKVCEQGVGMLLLHYCAFTIVMLIVAAVAQWLYDKLLSPLFEKLNKYEIPYNIE